MLTRFGKFCRKLRIENGELLFDMAQRLGVSSAFLSKVENGKSKPPVEWKEEIASMYNLSTEQVEELGASIKEARVKRAIDISMMSSDEKDMMFAFARKLDSMDEIDKNKWKKLLNM
ncbi:helix-turn-helix domain-containing protein [Acetatifactor muris]|uniref:Helix-turn-helix domain protein n=1 Tax=Acetatifactor muris TaxID=879566 RepID=A0A2K4ZNH6_9FIRM|nr:helix-turn-helix transcriptional regulator [Acetatifactor muris]MCR2050371.1 helix-turn-helix domain-containing protein [Acetatifactor muris]SOY32037.1 Helix-turn-helix domain protein [Acetatifactor muris]